MPGDKRDISACSGSRQTEYDLRVAAPIRNWRNLEKSRENRPDHRGTRIKVRISCAVGTAHYNLVTRNRSALPTTLTEDNAIAAAAMIGDSRSPNTG